MAMRLSRSIVGEAEAEAVRRVIVEDGYLGIGAGVQRDARGRRGVRAEAV